MKTVCSLTKLLILFFRPQPVSKRAASYMSLLVKSYVAKIGILLVVDNLYFGTVRTRKKGTTFLKLPLVFFIRRAKVKKQPNRFFHEVIKKLDINSHLLE